MLRSLHIVDYQSHKKTKMTFSNGINVIVGENNNGKTVIFRAFSWLTNNKPSGLRHLRRQSKEGIVKVKAVFDNCTVSLEKSKKNSGTYRLKKVKKEEKFEKFGQSVPDLVTEAINMSEVNFQGQLDASFMILQSNAQITKAINSITNVELYDALAAYFTKEVNFQRRTISLVEAKIDSAREELKNFPNLKKTKKLLDKAFDIEKNINIKIKKYKVFRDHANIALNANKQINELETAINELEKHLKKIERIENKILDKKQQNKIILKLKELDDEARSYRALINKRIKQLVEELRKMKICPTCNSSITSTMIKKIAKGLKK